MAFKPIIMSPSINKEFGEFISQGKDLTDILDWLSHKSETNQINLSEFLGDNVVLAGKNPGDVFTEDELKDWAESNGYMDDEKELKDFSDKEIIDYLEDGGYKPDDIFDYKELCKWAKENGFILAE